MIKIIVDCMGGDLSPNANVEGALLALENISDVQLILVGNESLITPILEGKVYDKDRLTILHAEEEITCHDKPTEAIRQKKESSMVKAFELLRSDESLGGLVSTGSTGALLAGAVMRIGRIKGVKRPAFCPILPTMGENIVGICDSGANVDCDSLQLKQFAMMGNLYLKHAYKIESPRVALLNVGVEDEKGDMLRKETYALLKEDENVNFVGNMEARELLSGDYDLVVCDGFAGNVLLKSTEGTAIEMMKLIKKAFYKNVKNKLAALMIKSDFMKIKEKMDYNRYGGAVLLGANKTIVKGHGSSKAYSVYKCIEQAYMMEKANLRESISLAMAKSDK